jgi:hypothetical protein
MYLAITSLLSVIALCVFILIAMYLGAVAAFLIVYAICVGIIISMIGIIVGVAAVIAERIERRRELAHGQ